MFNYLCKTSMNQNDANLKHGSMRKGRVSSVEHEQNVNIDKSEQKMKPLVTSRRGHLLS